MGRGARLTSRLLGKPGKSSTLPLSLLLILAVNSKEIYALARARADAVDSTVLFHGTPAEIGAPNAISQAIIGSSVGNIAAALLRYTLFSDPGGTNLQWLAKRYQLKDLMDLQ